MGKNSSIEWTDHTFNPWWGCIKVSPGCENCYAETLSKRYGHNVWGPAKTTERRVFSPRHWAEPFAWNAAAEKESVRRRVFCASMADVFEDHPGIAFERVQLWSLIGSTPWLDWLLLTKRPENIMRMVPPHWRRECFPPNVWVGVSVEDQRRADERIPILLSIPAAIRFLSCEPLLEMISLDPWLHTRRLHWVIIGGESGAQARPFSTWWARRLLVQTAYAGVATFVKELGSNPVDTSGRPIKLSDYKGADMSEWPEDLQIRQWPQSRAVPAYTMSV